ncbi:MAG: hypothetical protein H7Z14_15595, partial [Anaerolineae bacterium]|nr:hypothetical protein [Phycisphaerae bacterium]
GGVAIDDSSNVFWVGDWNDADLTKDIGIFMNGELLVQEGVTLINGVTLATISTVQDNISISDNGQWLTFEGVLSNGLDGAFLVSVPEPASAGLLLGLAMVPAMRRRSR